MKEAGGGEGKPLFWKYETGGSFFLSPLWLTWLLPLTPPGRDGVACPSKTGRVSKQTMW